MERRESLAHSLRLCVEAAVTQKATNESCDFVLSCRNHHKTIPPMAKLSVIEAGIPSEQRGVARILKSKTEVFVCQAFPRPAVTHLADCDTPRLQQSALSVQDVFIRNDQACTRSSTYSGAVYWREWSRNA